MFKTNNITNRILHLLFCTALLLNLGCAQHYKSNDSSLSNSPDLKFPINAEIRGSDVYSRILGIAIFVNGKRITPTSTTPVSINSTTNGVIDFKTHNNYCGQIKYRLSKHASGLIAMQILSANIKLDNESTSNDLKDITATCPFVLLSNTSKTGAIAIYLPKGTIKTKDINSIDVNSFDFSNPVFIFDSEPHQTPQAVKKTYPDMHNDPQFKFDTTESLLP